MLPEGRGLSAELEMEVVDAGKAAIGGSMTAVELSFGPETEGEVVPSANAGGTK